MPEPKQAQKPAPAAPKKYAPPTPSAVVVWRNAPGGEPNFAVVTRNGKTAIDVMVFPPESRIGVPKSGVRYVGDPEVKHHLQSDSGVWDFTDEGKLLHVLVKERASRLAEVPAK